MDVQNKDSIGITSDIHSRQVHLNQMDTNHLEVPKVGEDNLNRVTQSSEPYNFSKSSSEENNHQPYQHCEKPGVPIPSVDNTDDAGVDCTREPDWQVVRENDLHDHPKPEQVHNDRYWDERSLDREISDQDHQTKLLYDEQYISDRARNEIDEYGRPFKNEVLDPYYQSTIDPPHHNS